MDITVRSGFRADYLSAPARFTTGVGVVAGVIGAATDMGAAIPIVAGTVLEADMAADILDTAAGTVGTGVTPVADTRVAMAAVVVAGMPAAAGSMEAAVVVDSTAVVAVADSTAAAARTVAVEATTKL